MAERGLMCRERKGRWPIEMDWRGIQPRPESSKGPAPCVSTLRVHEGPGVSMTSPRARRRNRPGPPCRTRSWSCLFVPNRVQELTRQYQKLVMIRVKLRLPGSVTSAVPHHFLVSGFMGFQAPGPGCKRLPRSGSWPASVLPWFAR